jgi:formylglycine-generating enzyme required for sulfatase activity
MGNNSTATYAGDVCVDGFFLSQYEITNAQFRRFRATHDSGGHLGHTLNDDDQPVVRVNWQDAVAFAAWLSEEIGTQIRLATEAEWEYACRYGRNRESAEKVSGYGNLRESGNEPEYEATVAVGSYEAGLQGAYDMHGNASEWVLDTYVEDADRYGDNRENPRIEIETTTLRVRRGGSWSSSKTQSSCDARDYYLGELAVPHTGFRLVAKPT